ncbi:MAG: hypothetical protein JXQ72_16495 [Anaerolineae bacterium]|nr:hypothetical protein [Anaerolineae bacterium]
MSHDSRFDDELADLTDRLLAGEEIAASGELAELGHIVRQLHSAIDSRPEAASVFQDRLTQRLKQEWNLHHHRRPRRWWQHRPVALVAAVTLVLFVVAIIGLRDNNGDGTFSGTALDSPAGVVGIVVIVLGIGLVALWLRRRQGS